MCMQNAQVVTNANPSPPIMLQRAHHVHGRLWPHPFHRWARLFTIRIRHQAWRRKVPGVIDTLLIQAAEAPVHVSGQSVMLWCDQSAYTL